MLNKQLEIKLAGEKTQLWFNNYSTIELQKLFGVDEKEIIKKVSERAAENYMLLLSDLVKAGIKGYCYAKGINTPDVYDNINEHIAVADINELLQVWSVFYDAIGGNEPVEESKKKAVRTKR